MPRIGWGLLSPSPFCTKLEIVLRMRGERYELRPTLSPRRAPRGKLPWIELAGERIADSSEIVRFLERRADLLHEQTVAPEARARAHLVQRTSEESLYFVLVAERWRIPALRERYAEDLFSSAPRLARAAIARVFAPILERQLWQQGYGRHQLQTLLEMGKADLDAVARALGEAPYFTGDRPRAVDASVFGLLANIWYIPVDTALRQALAEHGNLVRFLERMREQYAADVPRVVPA